MSKSGSSFVLTAIKIGFKCISDRNDAYTDLMCFIFFAEVSDSYLPAAAAQPTKVRQSCSTTGGEKK
jgi:hypothetical protein